MKFGLRFVFLMMCLIATINVADAQLSDVRIGVNGLTCSQCTRNVEMSLRKLNFVQDVEMDLQHTEGKITLKANSRFDPEAIVDAIKAAGFSTRFLTATIDFSAISLLDNTCFLLNEDSYRIVPTPTSKLSDVRVVRFIGKNYLPHGELKKWAAKFAEMNCIAKRTNHYLITLQSAPQ